MENEPYNPRCMSRNLLLHLALLVSLQHSFLRGETIHGLVVEDHSGAPIARAEVRVTKPGTRGLVADLETDREGRFAASEVNPSEYRVEVSKANFVSTTLLYRPGPATAEVGTSPRTLLVRLVRCGAVEGRVVDAQGQPVAGAQVTALEKREGSALRRLQGTKATSDESGAYRIYGLMPGQYVIAASYDGFRNGVGVGVLVYPTNAQPRALVISGGEELRGIDFHISPDPLSSVRGNVEIPESGGSFAVSLVPADLPAFAIAVSQTSPTGAFRFEGIPPGEYDLLVSGPAAVMGSTALLRSGEPLFGRARIHVAGSEVGGLTVPVNRGLAAAFLLRSRPPRPEGPVACPVSALLSLSPEENWASVRERSTQVDFSKERTLDNLAPGRYRLRVAGLEPCSIGPDTVIDLAGAAGPSSIALEVRPAGSLRGQLRSASAA